MFPNPMYFPLLLKRPAAGVCPCLATDRKWVRGSGGSTQERNRRKSEFGLARATTCLSLPGDGPTNHISHQRIVVVLFYRSPRNFSLRIRNSAVSQTRMAIYTIAISLVIQSNSRLPTLVSGSRTPNALGWLHNSRDTQSQSAGVQ